MDMGTGKTKVSLDLLGALYLDQKVDRLLVVTKFSTRKNWEREVGIHLPFEADVMVLDTTKPKVFEKWNTAGDRFKILIVGTESLAAGSAVNYADAFLMVSTRAAMVVDEAHMIKNHSAVRSKACVSLGRKAEYRFIMTGTPVANGPMDVFMQFEFLDPNIIGIGDFYSFRNRYAVMGGYEGKEIVGYQNLDELIELISPFIFQVRKSEVLTELPPKVFAVREVQMTDEQKRLYRQISKEDKAVSGDRGVTVKSVLERMLRLQEICGGIIAYERNPDLYNPDKYEHCRIPGKNPKVEELKAIMEETEGAVIIWCRFLEEIAMVSEALRETYGRRSVVEIHGGIGEQQRDDNVQAFQRGELRPVGWGSI
jgi:SNF2 family DNA or RNA helicase